jgi:hypothetical protein
MLELVLSNCKVTAVPLNNESYISLTHTVLANEALANTNVAHIIRSRVDLINLEVKLYQLIVNELGFNQTTRLFENALKPNLNSNDKINDEAD